MNRLIVFSVIAWCFAAKLAVAVLFHTVPAQATDAVAGVPFDLQGFLDQEISVGNRRIVVPPGRYRVSPKNRQHLVLHNLQDTQIVADGVEMICTETTRALTIRGCTNVTVRGLVIDYDPLPFTQGRITSLSADEKNHEIEFVTIHANPQNLPTACSAQLRVSDIASAL